MLIRTVFAVLLECYLHTHWTLWLPRFCCFSVIRVCSRAGYMHIYPTYKVTRRNSLHWIHGMHCLSQLFILILIRLVSMEVCWTLQHSCNALFMELSVIAGSGTAWPQVASPQCGCFCWLSLDMKLERARLVFSDRCCLFSRRREFRFFPLACTSTPSCCSQQRFHWCVSHPLIHPGESTIWIQDDGLQILHHHKERYELCIVVLYPPCLNERSRENAFKKTTCCIQVHTRNAHHIRLLRVPN